MLLLSYNEMLILIITLRIYIYIYIGKIIFYRVGFIVYGRFKNGNDQHKITSNCSSY